MANCVFVMEPAVVVKLLFTVTCVAVATNLNQNELLGADPQHEGTGSPTEVNPTLVYGPAEVHVPGEEGVRVIALEQFSPGCANALLYVKKLTAIVKKKISIFIMKYQLLNKS